jgi:hypothetical protein
MIELAAISPERHAKKAWKQATDYAFAARDAVIPLVDVEFSKVVPAMPMGFIEQEDGYQLVAITSLQPGANLYVAPDGKWLVPYIPAALRAYPFKLAQQEENAENLTLCINEASGLVVDNTEDGNVFFDDQDEPTQKTKDILNFLTEIEASRANTQRAVDALADASLITPWALNLRQEEKVVPVEGLFHVDEAALNKLDDADFLTLRKAGGLLVAYAQLLSMNQLAVLERLGEIQGQMLAQATANSEAVNLTGFSLDEDEGLLNFD